MTREQEMAIKGLNQFKNMNLLYGNKLGITIEGVKQLQNDINEVLNLIQKQDKIIDELAKAFKQDDVRTVEEIKQFYERKVEDETK